MGWAHVSVCRVIHSFRQSDVVGVVGADGREGSGLFFGLPRGRRVLFRFNRAALLLAHASSPKGQLRRMQFRTACNSASVCGSLPHASQRRGSVGSLGWPNQRGRAEGFCARAQAELQRHSSLKRRPDEGVS
jgi:hypothetical protein